MKKLVIYFSIIFSIIIWIRPVIAFEVYIINDKLSLNAQNIPLQNILLSLARQGIRVQADPKLNPEISACFYNKDVQKGLKSILKSIDYILIWESIPETSKVRLAEIQVFEPGNKALIQPVVPCDNFIIAKNPEDGSLFVQDEILIKKNPVISDKKFAEFLRGIKGIIIEQNNITGIYRVRLPENTDVPALVKQLNKNPGVAGSEPNYAYPISLPYKNIAAGSSFSNLNLVPAPDGAVPVAVLDSGLLPDSGLDDVVLASLDAVNPENAISDSLGHGTQMALIASGAVKPLGVINTKTDLNPVVPIRAFDDNGVTSNFSIMRSIDFALEKGARVLSLSWGSQIKSDFLEQALDYADSKQLIVVASAGNEPTGKPVWPAAYSSVIGVGALEPDGTTWEKSNYGSFVAISAPGFASLPVGYKGEAGDYAGTSISAAYVANIIARYLCENPDATKADILKNVLKTNN